MIGYLVHDHPLIHAFQPARRTRREAQAASRIFKMAPKLSDYFQDGETLAVKGTLDRPISGLAIDSRRVVPGTLFFALPGQRADGASYIDEAVSRGAVAVVTSRMPAFPPAKVTFLQVADPRAMLARVAQRYYRFPDRDLTVAGVTGTNGKTTVTHLLKHFLNGDQRVGLIGTTHYDLGARTVPSFRTTPESLDIFGMMAQMRDHGCRQAVMERIEEGQAFNVLVDYAHTDDALRNALGMLRRITPGRLLVVFGCGGNRDRTKRPLMTRAVQEFADFAVATADNPRTEAIARIFEDMSGGVTAPEKISWIEDRRRAISLALDLAKPGDCVLIAGKGHECYQEFADTVFPFDDRQVVRELIGLKSHQLPV